MSRIGFDVDGVLADFNSDYIKLHIKVTGKNLFGPDDALNPPMWDYPAYRGYTEAETSEVWKRINASMSFWYELPSHYENCQALIRSYNFYPEHDFYFITSRPGSTAKKQTEWWLSHFLSTPTVLVVGSGQKGYVAKALQLDAYIDDYYDNCEDVVRTSPTTRCYVLDRRYNWRDGFNQLHVLEQRRVKTVDEFLHREGLIT